MTTFSATPRLYGRSSEVRALMTEPHCFTCFDRLTIGPSRRRGFCGDCWERSRLVVDDQELGGES